MYKNLKILLENYGSKEPAYFGPEEQERKWMKWLKKLKHEVHEDGSASIHETVYLESKSLQRLPFNFKTIKGSFWCFNNKLVSLQGSPSSVEGGFMGYNNKLTSLEGAPSSVGGDFWCNGNNLTSLEGAPKQIGGEFRSDQFSDEQYRDFTKNEKYVKGKLDKEFDIDLKDF